MKECEHDLSSAATGAYAGCMVALGFGPSACEEDAIEVVVPGEGAAIGAVYRTGEGRERRAFVRAPMVAVIPPGEGWHVQCEGPRDTLLIHLSPRFYAERALAVLGESIRLAARYAAFDPFIREIANALLAELRTERPLCAAYLDPLAAVMAVHLARHYGEAAPQAAGVPRGLPLHRLKRVQAFVLEHIEEVIHVDRLAGEAHMSPFHFARMFREATGQPPHLYIVMQRVSRAKALLQSTELPLIEVAQRTGFRTQGHFTGVFGRYTGLTPRAFRLACRAGQAG